MKKSLALPISSVSIAALALSACVAGTENQEEGYCVYAGRQVSCEEFRELEKRDREAFEEWQKAGIQQAKADSLAYAKDSASIRPVLAAKPLGAMMEIPSGTYRREDGIDVAVMPFDLSNVELTGGRYAALMAKAAQGSDAAAPAVLTWKEAVLACNAASLEADRDTVFSYVRDTQGAIDWGSLKVDLRMNGFRLPTEAEWEYAARGGVDSRFYWGDASTDSASRNFAWSLGNSRKPSAVGRRIPNQYGLHDMLGNAWEFTLDTAGPMVLAKGGSHLDSSRAFSVAIRNPLSKDSAAPSLTARLARTRVPDGVVLDLYPDGTVRSRREYKGGVVFGTRETYLRNGDVLKEFFDGVKTGQRLFDSSGAMIDQTIGDNGFITRVAYKLVGSDSIKHGPEVRLWSGGQVAYRATWVDGKLQGPAVEYEGDGALRTEQTFVDGLLSGFQSRYGFAGLQTLDNREVRMGTHGKIHTRIPYLAGIAHGMEMGWRYPEGRWQSRPNTEALWENGKRFLVVSLIYGPDSATVVEKRAYPGDRNTDRPDVLTYGPDGSILSHTYLYYTRLELEAYPVWYPSGALKAVHRLTKTWNAASTPSYVASFAEDGRCLESCDKLGPRFDVHAYTRPADLEDTFHRRAYRPFPADLTGYLLP